MHNIRREGFTPTTTSYICSEHFNPEMFTDGSVRGKRKCLKVDAVPTGKVN
jgi:hypothetical protein